MDMDAAGALAAPAHGYASNISGCWLYATCLLTLAELKDHSLELLRNRVAVSSPIPIWFGFSLPEFFL